MLYLEKTTTKNGCLRVIPGSHIEYNETIIQKRIKDAIEQYIKEEPESELLN